MSVEEKIGSNSWKRFGGSRDPSGRRSLLCQIWMLRRNVLVKFDEG